MNRSGKILVIGGLLLSLWGMAYGLFYAVAVEHQTLEHIGGSLAASFERAAEGNLADSAVSLQEYAAANYDYIRQVDAHGHWIGLGMLLIVLGLAFGRVGFSESGRRRLAYALLAGAAIFPLGVILETLNTGALPKAISIAGSAIEGLALAAVAFGFKRVPRSR